MAVDGSSSLPRRVPRAVDLPALPLSGTCEVVVNGAARNIPANAFRRAQGCPSVGCACRRGDLAIHMSGFGRRCPFANVFSGHGVAVLGVDESGGWTFF